MESRRNLADWFVTCSIVLVGVFSVINGLHFFIIKVGTVNLWPPDIKSAGIAIYTVGFIIVLISILVAVRPNDPLPWNWVFLFVLGVPLVALGFLHGDFRLPGLSLCGCGILLALYSKSKEKSNNGIVVRIER